MGEVKRSLGEGYLKITNKLKRFQKALRVQQTDVENHLWRQLRSRRFQGWKFRRQHLLEGYIVDFVCLERKIIVELDGGHHADQKSYDEHRTQILEAKGFKVIRFWNSDVLTNLEGVLEVILNTPHPRPKRRDLPQGER